MRLLYEVVDVFTNSTFTGNNLAVVYGCDGLSTETLSRICREFNYSETAFLMLPTDPQHTARLRIFSIFSECGEISFAGHPSIGAACALGWKGAIFGKMVGDVVSFEVMDAVVKVTLMRESGRVVGASCVAPAPLTKEAEVSSEAAAAALGLTAADVATKHHAPVDAHVGGQRFILTELTGVEALGRIDKKQSKRHNGQFVFAYARAPAGDTVDIRCRSTCEGHEDSGTGSANCSLMGLLASMEPGAGTLKKTIGQGEEVCRPSVLHGEADYSGGKVTEIRIGGHVVEVMRGELLLDVKNLPPSHPTYRDVSPSRKKQRT